MKSTPEWWGTSGPLWSLLGPTGTQAKQKRKGGCESHQMWETTFTQPATGSTCWLVKTSQRCYLGSGSMRVTLRSECSFSSSNEITCLETSLLLNYSFLPQSLNLKILVPFSKKWYLEAKTCWTAIGYCYTQALQWTEVKSVSIHIYTQLYTCTNKHANIQQAFISVSIYSHIYIHICILKYIWAHPTLLISI